MGDDAVGNVLLTVSRGTLDKATLELGGPFERLFGAINPFQETDASTELLCAVAYLPLSRGVARIDRSLAIESTKAGASASGTLDFRHETLDLSFETGVRQGISLDIARVAQLVRLTGPFRDPASASMQWRRRPLPRGSARRWERAACRWSAVRCCSKAPKADPGRARLRWGKQHLTRATRRSPSLLPISPFRPHAIAASVSPLMAWSERRALDGAFA